MAGVLVSRWILLICEVDERQIKQPFILYRPLSSVLCPGRFLQLRMWGGGASLGDSRGRNIHPYMAALMMALNIHSQIQKQQKHIGVIFVRFHSLRLQWRTLVASMFASKAR